MHIILQIVLESFFAQKVIQLGFARMRSMRTASKTILVENKITDRKHTENSVARRFQNVQDIRSSRNVLYVQKLDPEGVFLRQERRCKK